jgi:lysophospholipase L1-like esterase
MDLQWTQMDRWGWLALTHGVPTAEEYQRSLELTHTQHQPALQQFHISDSCNRAMRELLDLCRREHIPAVLVLMPEATAFRSWYPLRTRVQLHTWLGELSEAYGVPLVDASDWLADAYFGDGHHLHPQGAARFTERLGREVIQPFLRK